VVVVSFPGSLAVVVCSPGEGEVLWLLYLFREVLLWSYPLRDLGCLAHVDKPGGKELITSAKCTKADYTEVQYSNTIRFWEVFGPRSLVTIRSASFLFFFVLDACYIWADLWWRLGHLHFFSSLSWMSVVFVVRVLMYMCYMDLVIYLMYMYGCMVLCLEAWILEFVEDVVLCMWEV